MSPARYSVRIGEARCIGAGLAYQALLARIMEFTLRAAVARSEDESEWEHEQLRRSGLGALQLFRNDKAIWDNPQTFADELAEARREDVVRRFRARNELDPAFYVRLDGDLRARWRRLGYETPSLHDDMKVLFWQLERDAAERAADARKRLLAEFVKRVQEMT
jgi:hypothetical protein